MSNYRASTLEDCLYVAKHMRQADKDECLAGGLDPYLALVIGLNNSHLCITLVTPDGEPVAMLGVRDSKYKGVGMVWMLGTDAIEKHSIKFLRGSKPVLDLLFEQTGYQALYNFSHSANTVHHKWLKWLGFTFLREIKRPPYDSTFLEFVRLRT